MIETDSPYCEIKNTHAGINFVKSIWPSKKKEKYDQECIVKGRNEPCLVRSVFFFPVPFINLFNASPFQMDVDIVDSRF